MKASPPPLPFDQRSLVALKFLSFAFIAWLCGKIVAVLGAGRCHWHAGPWEEDGMSYASGYSVLATEHRMFHNAREPWRDEHQEMQSL